MRRREFIKVLSSAAAWPFAAQAQQPIGRMGNMPRVGILMPGPPPSATILEPFYRGLHELGYVDGQNIAIERRYADSIVERLPDLAAELVKLKVDVIVAWSTPPALAAQQATSTIPIVAAVTELNIPRITEPPAVSHGRLQDACSRLSTAWIWSSR